MIKTIHRIGSIFSNIYYDFINNARKVKGNPQYICTTQFLWAITTSMYMPFLTQYMKEVGLTNSQIGLVNGICMGVGFFFAVFASWLADRMGRRWCYMMSDTISWVLGCAVWAVSRNVWGFLLAAVFQAFLRINVVPWNCLMTEGVPPENRLSVFAIVNLASIVGAFCAPFMNMLIRPLGLVMAMRIVLGASALLYFIAFTWRHFKLVDSDMAIIRKRETKGLMPWTWLKNYPPLIRGIFHSKELMAIMIIKALYIVQMNLRASYLSITVIQGLHFDVGVMGIISLVNGAIMLLCQFFIVPKLARFDKNKTVLVGMLIGLVSHILLIAAPPNQAVLLFSSVIGNAVFITVAGMLIDTIFANTMSDDLRSGLLGVMGLISVAASAPFQYLGGALADLPGVGSRMPMVLISMLIGASLLVFLPTIHKERKKIKKG